MALTPYANELCLDYLLNSETVVRPTGLYLAWHIGSPGDDGSANEQIVANDPDYVRQAIAFDSSIWSSALKSGISLNSNSITITPAIGISYDVLGLSIWDSSIGGNCLAAVSTKTAIPVSDTAPVTFIAGKIPVIISSNNQEVSLTSYSILEILDWLLTSDTATRPSAWYFGLHSASPGDAGTANEITTGDDPDYARKITGFSAASTVSGSETSCTNNIDSIWTPGTGADFTAPFVVAWDSVSSGNALVVISCAFDKIGLDGQTLSVSASEVTVAARV